MLHTQVTLVGETNLVTFSLFPFVFYQPAKPDECSSRYSWSTAHLSLCSHSYSTDRQSRINIFLFAHVLAVPAGRSPAILPTHFLIIPARKSGQYHISTHTLISRVFPGQYLPAHEVSSPLNEYSFILVQLFTQKRNLTMHVSFCFISLLHPSSPEKLPGFPFPPE